MALTIPQLSSFGVSPTLGFLGVEPPLLDFGNAYYEPWDSLLRHLPDLISSGKLKQEVAALPTLITSKLSSGGELQRAYVALAFIIHGYVWGGDLSAPNQATETIPPQLSEPFLEVCKRIDTQPVLSYSGLCLWNWALPKDQSGCVGFPELENLAALGSFTGSKGEDAFYLVPVLIEAEGGHLVSLLLNAIEAASQSDFNRVKSALETATASLKSMGEHLPKLFSTLDAEMFYHQIRPFLAGGKGAEDKGLLRGMVFQRSDGSEEVVQCIGGSAAQSSLFPFLDAALGVKHQEAAGNESVLREMRSYMPGKHRRFLEQVESMPSIRSFVEKRPADTDLHDAYDECLKQLRLWRGKHIAVVSKYIVQPARAATKAHTNGHARSGDGADDFHAEEGEQLQGTAGSALIPFLRQVRDETTGIARKE